VVREINEGVVVWVNVGDVGVDCVVGFGSNIEVCIDGGP
jgi:hypothetical protein